MDPQVTGPQGWHSGRLGAQILSWLLSSGPSPKRKVGHSQPLRPDSPLLATPLSASSNHKDFPFLPGKSVLGPGSNSGATLLLLLSQRCGHQNPVGRAS